MTELKLYPTHANLKKGVFFGAVLLIFSVTVLFGRMDLERVLVSAACFAFGGYLLVTSLRYLRLGLPVFAADYEGFSVKGGAKRPWSDFRGVHVRYNGTRGIGASKTVQVQVGKSMFGGSLQITGSLQSDAPEVMANQIQAFAHQAKTIGRDVVLDRAVQRAEIMPQATLDDPMVTPIGHAPAPVFTPAPDAPPLRFAERLDAAGGGPVQSQPTLGERIFGRRKVM